MTRMQHILRAFSEITDRRVWGRLLKIILMMTIALYG